MTASLQRKKIGEGVYGEVFTINDEFAVKIFEDADDCTTEKAAYNHVRASSFFLKILQKTVSIDDIPPNRMMFMEYYPTMETLTVFMKKARAVWGHPRWEKYCDTFVKIFHNIIECLVFLTNNRLSHNDLKPDNILITPDGDIKLIDLGLLRKYGIGNEVVTIWWRSLRDTHNPYDPDDKTDIGSLWLITLEFLLPWQHCDIQEIDKGLRSIALVSRMESRRLMDNHILPELTNLALIPHYGKKRGEMVTSLAGIIATIDNKLLSQKLSKIVTALITMGMTPIPSNPVAVLESLT